MNKFVCLALFASSALAAPAPQAQIEETSALVDTILSQLDGTIDAAIQAALSGAQTKGVTNFQGTFSQGPAVTVSTSGSVSAPGATGQFSSTSTSQSSSSDFSSSTTSGEWSAWTTVGTSGQSVPRPVAVATPDVTAEVSQVSSEQAVISSVVKQLEGSIAAAVDAALSGSQNTNTATTAVAVQPAPAPAPIPAKAFTTTSHSTNSQHSSFHHDQPQHQQPAFQ